MPPRRPPALIWRARCRSPPLRPCIATLLTQSAVDDCDASGAGGVLLEANGETLKGLDHATVGVIIGSATRPLTLKIGFPESMRADSFPR